MGIKVVQLSTLIFNHDKFSSKQMNLFSRKMYYIEHEQINLFSRKMNNIEHAAEKSNRRPNLKLFRRNDIRNVENITPDL